MSDILTSNAVVLRIDKDSQQEALLSAFCKVDGYPSLVVIKYVQEQCLKLHMKLTDS